ncbi:MAG: hypothetical protein WDZ35_13035 [Crocinitomicaceae bacterium]
MIFKCSDYHLFCPVESGLACHAQLVYGAWLNRAAHAWRESYCTALAKYQMKWQLAAVYGYSH